VSKSFSGKLLMVAAVLTLSACSNSSFLNGGNSSDSAGLDQPGLVGDVTSPAYFQQAIGDRVLFEVDQSTLTADAQATLVAQAQWLIANPDYNATIEGHADEQGTREYNLALGARRASAAREYIVSQGVAGSRLKTLSYGKERPLEICSEESCYSRNRRAVTVLATDLTG
jgi:peptidoglycan-associated lipoprotein